MQSYNDCDDYKDDINKLNIHDSLQEDFIRVVSNSSSDIFYTGGSGLSTYEVLKAHYLIIEFFRFSGKGIGGIGPKDVNLLHSAVWRQFTAFGGRYKWDAMFDRAATLLFGLIKNHPFYDANKRTAFLSCLYYLHIQRRVLTVKQKDFEQLTVDIANNKWGWPS